MAGVNLDTRRMLAARELEPGRARTPGSHRGRAGARVEATAGLAPRGVGQILDAAFEVYSARFAFCVVVATVVWLPFEISLMLLMRSQVDITVPTLLVGFLTIPVKVFTAAAICSVVSGDLFGKRVTAGEALGRVVARAPGLAGLSLLMMLAVVPLACMCLIPLYVGIWLVALAPVIHVLEQGRISRSVARSAALVWGWGYFGRWLGYTLVIVCLFLPASLLAGSLSEPGVRSFFQEQLSATGELFELLIAFLNSVFNGLSAALAAVTVTVYYLDTRVRKEAFDLELALDRLIARREARDPGNPA